MEKKYYREDVIIEFNSRTDVWEIYEKESGIFIGDSATLVGLVNKFEFLAEGEIMDYRCGTCGGTGFNFGGIRCSQCSGTGKYIKKEFKVDTRSCGYCGGTGFLYGGMNCPKCKGNK